MRRVLVVDDDQAICDVLAAILADEGWAVSCAWDGEAALAAVAAEPPDLIVSDLMMPRLDGLGLRRRLREQGVRIPMLLMSAAADPSPDGVAFLAKPFDVDQLLSAVARLLP
jgi:CheY-like chemotaxis protein